MKGLFSRRGQVPQNKKADISKKISQEKKVITQKKIKVKKEFKKRLTQQGKVIQQKTKQITAKDKLSRIRALLNKGRKQLANKNIFGAKTTYRRIRRLHGTLKPGEKNKEIHNQLLTFHSRLTKSK